MGEIGAVGPGFEIWGGEDPDYKVLCVGNYHYPLTSLIIPRDMWISELVRGVV